MTPGQRKKAQEMMNYLLKKNPPKKKETIPTEAGIRLIPTHSGKPMVPAKEYRENSTFAVKRPKRKVLFR